MEESHEKRGVQNPRIIDLITPDSESGEIVLMILERRPWGEDPNQLYQLEDKLNAYLGYVLDNFLTRDYPQYAEMPVRVQLECAYQPGAGEEEFLAAATRFCVSQGIRFAVNVVDDPFGPALSWEG